MDFTQWMDAFGDLLTDLEDGCLAPEQLVGFLGSFLAYVHDSHGLRTVGADWDDPAYRQFVAEICRLHCISATDNYLEQYARTLQNMSAAFHPEADPALPEEARLKRLQALVELQRDFRQKPTALFQEACQDYFREHLAEERQALELSCQKRYIELERELEAAKAEIERLKA